MGRIRSVTVALAVAAGACGEEPTEDGAGLQPSVRDSAGVEVVVYPPLRDWEAPLTLVERTRIGVSDGANELLFSNLAGGKILGDGRIVLADRQAREVRLFGGGGEFIKSHGREGEGPEEYQFIAAVEQCRPGGFTVVDIGSVLTFYDGDGDYVEEQAVRLPDASSPYKFACHPSGLYAVTNWDRRNLAGPVLGLHVANARLRVLNTEGEVVMDLGERIGSERWGRETGSGPHPAGRGTVFGFLGPDLIVTDGSFFGFERWGDTGELHQLIRIDVPPPNVDSLATAYLDWTLDRAPNADVRRAWRASVEEMKWPEESAFFNDLRVVDDYVLAREISFGDDGRWFLFDDRGRPLGYLPLPDGATLLDMTSEAILVEEQTEMDVPQAVVYDVVWE